MYSWLSLVLGSRALESMTHEITFTSKLNKQEQATVRPSKLTRASMDKVMVTC